MYEVGIFWLCNHNWPKPSKKTRKARKILPSLRSTMNYESSKTSSAPTYSGSRPSLMAFCLFCCLCLSFSSFSWTTIVVKKYKLQICFTSITIRLLRCFCWFPWSSRETLPSQFWFWGEVGKYAGNCCCYTVGARGGDYIVNDHCMIIKILIIIIVRKSWAVVDSQ